VVGEILKDVIMKIEKPKHTVYMRSEKGFKIIKEDENGNIKSFRNLDDGKYYRF
jgi:hypothetical protein